MVQDTPAINGLVMSMLVYYDYIFADYFLAEAMFDYEAQKEDQISLKTGDHIKMKEEGDPKGWWHGELLNTDQPKSGLFPGSFVKIIQPPPGGGKQHKELQNLQDQLKTTQKLIEDLQTAKLGLADDITYLNQLKNTPSLTSLSSTTTSTPTTPTTTTPTSTALGGQTPTQSEVGSDDASIQYASIETQQLLDKIFRDNSELSEFGKKLEETYTQLEASFRTRHRSQQAKQAFVQQLHNLKKLIHTDQKYKKYRGERLGDLIDNLLDNIGEEDKHHALVDERKELIMKYLTKYRALVKVVPHE
eukprot:TRINITY_DN1052_c0_g1_i1.p1 TRINITY_DN1052_c0_g1~~TRINITY_DN1052_c0_g1_i1.p1  ORF type:complete len:346 (+),score=121.43 TRINITY_DN1052_c0_g1_i1:132-1040(+)